MPDLGKYGFEVLFAYGTSLAILAILIAVTFASARKSKARLDEAEDPARDA